MTLGEKLKRHRTQCGLSQEKVAETIGVSRQAVTKWEGDRSAPSSAHLIALASLYHVSLEELIAEQSREQADDKSILHANLTNLAILCQASWLSVVMRPFEDGGDPSFKVIELALKFVPLLASSIWMAYNLRYEKDQVQYRKNTKIELAYCMVQVLVVLFGYYSERYLLSTILLIGIVLFYIFRINPKYMNRQLVRKKERNRPNGS